MTAATPAYPELVGRPRPARTRVAHLHLCAAALAADVEAGITHARRFYNIVLMIPAIVLAAGRSSRMGRAKALLPLAGDDSFLTRIVRTFLDARVDDVVVVVGHDADTIVSEFTTSGLPARFVRNADYDRGQLSSLVAGLGVTDRPGVAAVLVTLVDVPLVSAATVRAVIERYRTAHALVVRPTSGARHGHPLLIDRALFAELRAADPSAGAKPIVRAHASADGDIAIDDEGAFTDIDTVEDYARIR
jgi:molybdenum cofactor cytidylyltransferase